MRGFFMEKDLSRMSISEIFLKIGKIITPESVYFLIDDEETLRKYTDMYEKFGSRLDEDRENLYDFLIEQESKVDKKILVLLTLEQYLKRKGSC